MRVLALVVALLSVPVALAATWLAAQDAADHIDEVATVCGAVASTNFAIRSKGQPTYLNLDRPYPNQVFTILIWGSTGRNSARLKLLLWESACVRRAQSRNTGENPR